MVNYVCIGKGTTDENGVAHITHDCNGNPLSEPGYKGSGAGETLIVASLDKPVSSSSLLSNVLSVSDVDNYLLSLTGDKSIGQTGDHITLSATLTNNGIPVSGKVINFVDPDNSSFSGTYPETTTINQYIGVAWTLSCSYGGYVFVGNNSNFLLISKSVGSVGVYVNGSRSASMTLVNGTVSLNGNVISSGGYSLDCSSYGIDLTNLRSVQVQSGTIEVSVSPIAVASAVTNSSGVAIFDYVCTGSGQKEFGAVYGSLQSEIYGVIDGMFSDLGTSDKSSSYNLYDVVYSQTDDYITLNNSTGGTKWVRPNVGGSSSYLDNQTDYCIEIDVKNIDSTQLVIILDGTPVNVKDYVSTSDFTHIKIYSSRSENKVYYVIDDVTRDINASNVTGYMSFRVGNNEGYSFRNFVIYPL